VRRATSGPRPAKAGIRNGASFGYAAIRRRTERGDTAAPPDGSGGTAQGKQARPANGG
jgi:hypothetical protein